jgi:undecaprenyl pyrophosphate synthase
MADPTYCPDALRDVPRPRWPRHIAVIMDGNGRWAEARGLPRFEGHRRGAETVRRVTEEAARLGGANWFQTVRHILLHLVQLDQQVHAQDLLAEVPLVQREAQDGFI